MTILLRCLAALAIGATGMAVSTGSEDQGAQVEGLANELNVAAMVTAATTFHSRRSDLVRGLFGTYRRNRKNPAAQTSHGRRRATDRPVNAVDVSDGGGVNATDDGHGVNVTDDGHGEKAATVGPERTVFGTEDECVSATGDERPRQCVCHTVDYLQWVAQRLDDEAVAGDDAVAGRAFDCQSYRALPAAFEVRPVDNTAAWPDDSRPDAPAAADSGDDDRVREAAARQEVQLAKVIDYRLAGQEDDHFAVHYGLLGSDVKIRCLANRTGMNAFKWDYEIGKHKTNSTIIGNDTFNLSILGLESADSKNYTCTPETDAVKNTDNSYRHYVIAVGNPMYEVRSTATYKTSGSGVCTQENVEPVRKQLPSFARTQLCPEGSTRYACNVVVESLKCAEDQKTLEITILMTLNEKADFLTKIRTSRKGRKALFYQQALARVLDLLAANLKKTLSVAIVSKVSLIDTRFESDRGKTKENTFVTCAPGFGMREVFCVACPPHHFSGNKSVECSKCPKGFHQPVAGSVKCMRCPHPFASGCYMKQIPQYVYYVTIFVIILVFGIFVASCLCCCREENEKNIRIIPRKIRRKFKRTKGYDLM